jgi:hypothetical protein
MEYLQKRVKRIQVEKGMQAKEVMLILDVRTRCGTSSFPCWTVFSK